MGILESFVEKTPQAQGNGPDERETNLKLVYEQVLHGLVKVQLFCDLLFSSGCFQKYQK